MAINVDRFGGDVEYREESLRRVCIECGWLDVERGGRAETECCGVLCTGDQMYTNLGNFSHRMPSGYVDQTVRYYDDKPANN